MKPLAEVNPKNFGRELKATYESLNGRAFGVSQIAAALDGAAQELGKVARRMARKHPELWGDLAESLEAGVSVRDVHSLLNTGRNPILTIHKVGAGERGTLALTLPQAITTCLIWRLTAGTGSLGPDSRAAVAGAISSRITPDVLDAVGNGAALNLVVAGSYATVVTDREYEAMEWLPGQQRVDLREYLYEALYALSEASRKAERE